MVFDLTRDVSHREISSFQVSPRFTTRVPDRYIERYVDVNTFKIPVEHVWSPILDEFFEEPVFETL